jgi:hypothetical protein
MRIFVVRLTQTMDFLPFVDNFRPAGRKLSTEEEKYRAAAG